jgi:hypothetical protein
MGFGEILHLDDCCVPRFFVQWVADNVSTDRQCIQIGSISIELSPQSVSDSLGTPAGTILVDGDEERGKAAFLACFGLSDVLSISFLVKGYYQKRFCLMRSFAVVSWLCLWGPFTVLTQIPRSVQSIWEPL